MSYRNHGRSTHKGSLRWRTINEYVEDVRAVVSNITGDVYLIGHSMGGFLVQHYLQQHLSPQLKKAVLLCSVPASGIGGATWQVVKTYPLSFLKALLTLSFKPVFNSKDKAKKLMFAPAVPAELIDAIVPRMQDESFRAYMDMMLLTRPGTQPTIPVLLIGGTEDFLIREASLRKNALLLGATLLMMNGGHNINLEQGWEEVAEIIQEFFGAEKGER
jgi:pimeloyl-ACP methyl ester carboxylesterase